MAVALYARVSTTKQADKDLSIPDQLRQMRDWSKRNGYSVANEYVEPGASATDDRRPEFQQMISDATLKPSPYEAIIVHSLSRFFRDSLQFALYERQLKKSGVKLISITQQTSDDAGGEMARKIFSMFDEYQSKETGKHTLRALKENARQGFFNGSKPPFGYKTEELDLPAAKGRKKRLVIDETEAPTVRRIFELYDSGLNGCEMGCLQIASHLDERGVKRRGAKWTRNRVQQLLSDAAYMGDYVFNKKDTQAQKTKPEDEWIRVAIDPLIDRQVFAAVSAGVCERDPLRWQAGSDARQKGCVAGSSGTKRNGHYKSAQFRTYLAPQPGLEPGTYGLTEAPTRTYAVCKSKICKEFFAGG